MNENKDTENTEQELTQEEKEDFWLEIGPASAYYGLESYGAALANGDASPDARLLGWPGAELSLPTGEEALDDVPPEDR